MKDAIVRYRAVRGSLERVIVETRLTLNETRTLLDKMRLQG
jgi:hypothetical protein